MQLFTVNVYSCKLINSEKFQLQIFWSFVGLTQRQDIYEQKLCLCNNWAPLENSTVYQFRMEISSMLPHELLKHADVKNEIAFTEYCLAKVNYTLHLNGRFTCIL